MLNSNYFYQGVPFIVNYSLAEVSCPIASKVASSDGQIDVS